MDLFTIEEKKRILDIIHYLISEKVKITADIKESNEQFITTFLKIDKGRGLGCLIIDKFYPEVGNSLIQSFPDVVFSFTIRGRKGVFEAKYRGINTEYPEFGLIVDFPQSIQIEDKRKEKRVEDNFMRILSAEFTLEGDNMPHQLKVINLGSHGIGLIIGRKNLDLLDKINVGDTIKNLTFFLTLATLTIDGEVIHKTPIDHGRLKGSYILGIKSDFTMNLKELEDTSKKEGE